MGRRKYYVALNDMTIPYSRLLVVLLTMLLLRFSFTDMLLLCWQMLAYHMVVFKSAKNK